MYIYSKIFIILIKMIFEKTLNNLKSGNLIEKIITGDFFSHKKS